MHRQLNLAVRALTQRYAFKLKLFKFHIGQHLLVLVLTGHPELTRLDERRRFLNPSYLSGVKS